MRIPRTRGAFAGLLLVALGAWAALIPFIGPYFNYGFIVDDAWHWDIDRLWLDILPGAAICLGGLMLLGTARRRRAFLGAWLAILGGAWLVAGPSVSLLWHDGAFASGAPLGGDARAMAEWLGFFYGAGALAILVAAYEFGVLGRLSVTAPTPTPAAAKPAVSSAQPAAARSGMRRRRGFGLRRRVGA